MALPFMTSSNKITRNDESVKIASVNPSKSRVIGFKKWIIHVAAHDGLFSHLKPNTNLGINECYLLPY
jgi:hypothetical protein